MIKRKTILVSNLIGRTALWSLTVFIIGCIACFIEALFLTFCPSNSILEGLIQIFRLSIELMVFSGSVLFIDLFIFYKSFLSGRNFLYRSLAGTKVNVGLTAFNDENCIGAVVKEFKNNPLVNKVIVVDNNSTDGTAAAALEAGADHVAIEKVPGYGSCCMRALAESASGLGRDDIIILCEGDMTFSAHDISKFLAYMENVDLVLGSRTTQELRASKTQMDWLINPFNQIVAKLMQFRFWWVRLSDVGCTYRAMRVGAYRLLKNRLKVTGHHFSPHMFMEALKIGIRVIEIPIVFSKRHGISKGAGGNKLLAARVAIRMLFLLYKI